MHPQVPAEQRTRHLWCTECFVLEHVDIDDVPEELGWQEGQCPDCAAEAARVGVEDGVSSTPILTPILTPEEAAEP